MIVDTSSDEYDATPNLCANSLGRSSTASSKIIERKIAHIATGNSGRFINAHIEKTSNTVMISIIMTIINFKRLIILFLKLFIITSPFLSHSLYRILHQYHFLYYIFDICSFYLEIHRTWNKIYHPQVPSLYI